MTKLAFDHHSAAVPVDDMFYNRKPQSGAANLARTVIIDSVKALGQARDVMRRDPLALVSDDDLHCITTQTRVQGPRQKADNNVAAGSSSIWKMPRSC